MELRAGSRAVAGSSSQAGLAGTKEAREGRGRASERRGLESCDAAGPIAATSIIRLLLPPAIAPRLALPRRPCTC